jgi:hypothetical protein
MTVDLTTLLPALASVTLVVGGIAAALIAIRRWIRNVARPAQAAADQLTTSNGRTVANNIEAMVGDIQEVKGELSTLNTWSTENREVAHAALTLARHMSDRLDAHLAGHGAKPIGD